MAGLLGSFHLVIGDKVSFHTRGMMVAIMETAESLGWEGNLMMETEY